MGSVPLAFSIHQFVSSVGSDAGFASIVGLAILILLYFAQARETAGLREQASEAAQRVEQLEARLARLARAAAQPVAAPEAAPAPARVATNSVAAAGVATAQARVPVGAGAVAMAPGPPAGVAAPALSAATRLIPAGFPRQEAEADARPGEATAVASPAETSPAETSPAQSSPAPVTAAGGGNGVPRDAVTPPPVAARLGGDAARTPGRPGPGQSPGRRPLTAPPAPPPRRSRVGRVAVVLLGLVLVGAAVAAVVLLTSNGTRNKTTASGTATTNAPAPAGGNRGPAFNPALVTVAVLNGTATPGLAHRTAVRLTAAGYKQGTVATASDQTHPTTTVAFLPGHRADAARVAGTLKLPAGAVQPIDQTARAVACPPPAPCTLGVVVTVGADLASS